MANISRKSDDDLVDFLIKEEGFLSKPTNIGDGKITLGSGLTDPKWHELYRKRGNKWSKEDNRKAVASEIASRRRWAESNIPNWDDLPDSSQKALLAYKYNYDFNAANSPKLYEALRNNNLLEAAKQMDATSKDPKFKKGLEQRRARERSWFLQDVSTKEYLPEPLMPEYSAYPVSSYYDNPYARRLLYTQPQPVMIPEEQIPQVRYSEPEERIKMDALNALESLGQLYDFNKENAWENQPEPERFIPKGRINFVAYDEGGQMNIPKTWNDLSMSEKAEMMRVAILNGITDLATIKQKYNEFAEGGNTNNSWTMEDEAGYRAWRKSLPDNLRRTNDNIYDMRSAYKSGAQPQLYDDGYYHLPSRDPRTGMSLKSPVHPTHTLATFTDGLMGYHPYTKNGKEYTDTWEGNEKMLQLTSPEKPPVPFMFAEGGSIHIDPSKKGTFTAAATKHGMGVQEFASKVLANKEDYSSAMIKKANFARNASKWKHAFGGNLFDGTSRPTQQMQLGSAYWKQQSRKPIFTKELAEFNKKKAEEDRQRREEFKKWAATKGKELVEKSQKDYLTTSNDNTWVENRNPTVKASKPKNPHLTERSVKGAKAHRVWEEEHPVLNTWENVLGAVPFAVASAPLAAAAGSGIAALGDAAAATSAGQAITAGLTPLTTAVSTSVAGAPLYTWADAGLSSLFGAHGIQTAIDEGGVSPTTALEIAPLGRLAKSMLDAGKQGLQYTTKAIDNTTRYASPSYDLYRTVDETPIINRSFPTKSLYRADVYKGGEIKDPHNISLTTDSKYAEQYGEVTPYLFESNSIAKAKEPLMGYRDPVNNDMFIYRNTKDVPGANAIVGHDLVTGEFPYNSKGTEIISLSPNNIYPKPLETPTIEWTDAANATPEVTHFYHGSPVRFDAFSADFIGSGEGGSKVMRGINLWPEEKIANAPKFANIKSPDAPLHLGVSNTPLGGELNPTVYDVSGRGLKLYTASPREVKRLSQSDLISQGYDGIQTPNQVTVFPESIGKLSIDKQSAIDEFILSHPEVERWTPWTTDTQKMQNIIDMSKMSKWTPEQWTAAQDAAIARGDIAEVQRLRDLHFKVSAPNTKIVDAEGNPLHTYHGGAKGITQFLNPNEFDSSIKLNNYYKNGRNRVGIYTSDWKSYAKQYARGYKKKDRDIYDLYVNMENPRYVGYLETKLNQLRNLNPFKERNYLNPSIIRPDHKEQLLKGYDGVKWDIENVVFDGKQLKLADAVTYDDNGVRIPLGERDNFSNPDIRYSWVPWFLGGSATAALASQKALGGPLVDRAMNYFEGGGQEDQEEPVYDTNLKEVTIKRSEDPIFILGQMNPEYKDTFLDIYDRHHLLSKPQASRLLEAYNYAGKPKIKPLPQDEDRAYYKPLILNITKPYMRVSKDAVEGLDDIIEELSHPLQEKYGNNKPWIEDLNPFYSGDDYRGKTRYDFPNKFESETHEDFQPLLDYYINQGILPGQEWVTYPDEGYLGNDSIIENPRFLQVMDSARVYNKRKQDVDYKYIKPRSTPHRRNKIISFFGDMF